MGLDDIHMHTHTNTHILVEIMPFVILFVFRWDYIPQAVKHHRHLTQQNSRNLCRWTNILNKNGPRKQTNHIQRINSNVMTTKPKKTNAANRSNKNQNSNLTLWPSNPKRNWQLRNILTHENDNWLLQKKTKLWNILMITIPTLVSYLVNTINFHVRENRLTGRLDF